jgi:two-component system, chemotaxis family, protein-glutamate methylesterase/glutaminase
VSAFDSLRARVDAIVIGGSAGAIDGLSLLLPALCVGLPIPVLIVVHLPRNRPSLLVEIFSPKCPLRVREAEDKEPIEPGTVYFAPPDYHLLVDQGPRIALSADETVHFSRPSIDVLFESAADAYKDRLMGIILSGANEDGADGLAAIHRAGGVTVVQAPESAQSTHMVTAALKLTNANFVLPIEQIAGLLRALGGPSA